MLSRRGLALFVAALLAAARSAGACNLCSIYTSLEAREARRGLYTGAFQQYTDFSTLRFEGEDIGNSLRQSLKSSVTQVVLGYQVNRLRGVQLNVPYLDKSFRRLEGDHLAEGSESGLGDVALLAHLRAYERSGSDSLAAWSLQGGLELPTGDSGRLREEGEDEHDPRRLDLRTESRIPNGVHGHDLALGSGSLDVLLGSSGFVARRRLFAAAQVQYAVRREGDHGYRYADDVTWSLEPGVYVWLRHGRSLSVGAQLFGEEKGDDELDGEALADTAMSAVYAGPKLTYSQGQALFAELAVDLPLRQDNSALQIVPDSRVRFTWRPGIGPAP